MSQWVSWRVEAPGRRHAVAPAVRLPPWRTVLTLVFVAAAFATRPLVRELDPQLAVQAAVLHDEHDLDPWGRPWRAVKGLHDSDRLVFYSTGPDGVIAWGAGDDVIPDFFFWGWGAHAGYGARTFPPEVWAHNLVLFGYAQATRAGRNWWLESDAWNDDWPIEVEQDHAAHLVAALVGWSRELGSLLAAIVALAPVAWRQARAPRAALPVELARVLLLASGPVALATWAAATFGPGRVSLPTFVLIDPVVACALTGALPPVLLIVVVRLRAWVHEHVSADRVRPRVGVAVSGPGPWMLRSSLPERAQQAAPQRSLPGHVSRQRPYVPCPPPS